MSNRILFSLVILLFLWACNPDKNRKVDQTTISFATNDATKLFFKNVRRTYYEVEEMEAAKMEVYRLNKRVLSQERPIINLAIVNNWRFDEAYVMLEPNNLLDLANLTLTWKNPETDTRGEIVFENGNKETYVAFADQVYEQIQLGSQFTTEVQGVQYNVLEQSEDREAFRITMVDYYRLVQRL